jgi:hypothetical protein
MGLTVSELYFKGHLFFPIDRHMMLFILLFTVNCLDAQSEIGQSFIQHLEDTQKEGTESVHMEKQMVSLEAGKSISGEELCLS